MAGKPRVTKQKQLIMAILKESAVPLTAGEIYERACRQQPTLAKSTVYRNLEALRERGEVSHGLLENGESLYEAVRPHEHKHYMICKGCNAMVDLPAARAGGGDSRRGRVHRHRPCHPALRLLPGVPEGRKGRTVRIKIGRPR